MKERYEKGAGDMHLDYPMTKSGLFILKKEDFDDISKEILTEYEPNALKSPQPLDVEHLIEECLFLDMKSERLSDDGKVLGLIAFADTVYTGIGDFWHIEETIPDFYDSNGNSLFLIHTNRGEELFEKIQSDLDYRLSNTTQCWQANLEAPTKKSEQREEFWNDYNKKVLHRQSVYIL